MTPLGSRYGIIILLVSLSLLASCAVADPGIPGRDQIPGQVGDIGLELQPAIDPSPEPGEDAAFVPGEVLVWFSTRNGRSAADLNTEIRSAHSAYGSQVIRDYAPLGAPGLQLIGLPRGRSVRDAVAYYKGIASVQYAEPNYYVYPTATTPNDPMYGNQWALKNTGQVYQNRQGLSPGRSQGTAGVDIHAEEAWDITTGSPDVVIAVIDSGVNYNHPDLTANIWTNPGEIPGNGIDDDHNGFIDDVHGWDFVENDNDPSDPLLGHGTHCSGIIAAAGNNGVGITGMMWQAKIMPLRFIDSTNHGSTANAIACILYAGKNGAVIMSNSWGRRGGYSQIERDVFDASPALMVVSAGNDALNCDVNPFYPASYNCAGIVSVASTNSTDDLSDFSCYGVTTIDLAAPGEAILSPYVKSYVWGIDFIDSLGYWNNSYSDHWYLNGTHYNSGSAPYSAKQNEGGNYTDNGFHWMCTEPYVNLAGWKNCSFEFRLRLDTADANDTMTPFFYNWTEGSWWSPGGWYGHTNGAFLLMTVNISRFDGEPNLPIAFRFMSDGAGTDDGAYLDNIRIVGVPESGYAYDYLDGTSMAGPYVAGVAGLMKSVRPSYTVAQTKAILLESVDPIPSLCGKVVTGGRLNASKALIMTTASPPPFNVTSITPKSGFVGSSVSMTIGGANFTSGSNVNLTMGVHSIPATNVRNSGQNRITCKFAIPLTTTTGQYDVVVTNNLGATGTKAKAFTVNPLPKPTISSVAPTSGLVNTTVAFKLSGTNFMPGSMVNFSHGLFGNVTAVLDPITSIKSVSGNVTLPWNASAGKWNIVLVVPDGRNATKTAGFEVKSWKPPKISSIAPTSGYRNVTLAFSLSGTDFEQGAVVNFTNSTYGNVTASLTKVGLKKIIGTVLFPPGAPTGKWDLSVTTPDGGQGPTKPGAFTVNSWKPPVVSSLTPTNGLLNTTVRFTLSGTSFQPGAMVNFTNTAYPGGNLTTEITVVSLTKITGNLTVPYNVPTGKWNVVVTTPDGGQGAPKTNAFTVNPWKPPTVSSINQTRGVHGTTIRYAITGTNFQPGSTVTFTNTSAVGLNFTAGVDTVVPVTITGSVSIPGSSMGKYGLEVLCPDGKTGKKDFAFTVT